MEKHIWKIKHWFSIAFVKLTILEVWIKYWFLFKYEQLKHWVPKEFCQFQENHQFPHVVLGKRMLTTQLCLKYVLHW